MVDIGGAFLSAEMSGSAPLSLSLDKTMTHFAIGIDKTMTDLCLLSSPITKSAMPVKAQTNCHTPAHLRV